MWICAEISLWIFFSVLSNSSWSSASLLSEVIVSVGHSAVDIIFFESKDFFFFFLLKKFLVKYYPGSYETLVTVASNAVVAATWLNVLWHVFQKCRLTLEDKRRYKPRWTYACKCLCRYLCSYKGWLFDKLSQKKKKKVERHRCCTVFILPYYCYF